MNHNKNRRPRGTAVAAGEPPTTVQPPADTYRARRIRRFARLELDELLAPGCCCCRGAVLDENIYSDVFRDGRLGVPERERRGRELLAAGFVP